MPSRMTRLCNAPGCTRLVDAGQHYCEQHQHPPSPPSTSNPNITTGRTDEQRARHRLYDRAWKKRREWQLSTYPWCASCLRRGHYVPAPDVHHIIPHRGSAIIFARSPLESLCHACHSRITATETPPRKKSIGRLSSVVGTQRVK